MKRSVYSLVLSDDVIEAIDSMAYSLGTSRSNLINQILADKVSLVTPEKRMENIFTELKKLMFEECYQIQERQSDSLMDIKSAIRYKYRPTVRYSLELFRSSNQGIGQLKVTFRTQSQALLQLVQQYFSVWSQLEVQYLHGNVVYSIEPARYTRLFQNVPQGVDVATTISEYIHAFDTALKQYFANASDLTVANASVESVYREYYSRGKGTI